jgi:hypothetical protein
MEGRGDEASLCDDPFPREGLLWWMTLENDVMRVMISMTYMNDDHVKKGDGPDGM